MSLCGFGPRLDADLRHNPRIRSVFTYLASGVNPLSWLKDKPYATIKTFSGFMSIESVDGKRRPLATDVPQGKAKAVPKLENLLAKVDPDVLVFQSGNNLYDLFRDGKTVNPERHGPMLDSFIVHFLAKAVQLGPRLRKIYWVAPPVTGRFSREIQEFLMQRLTACTAGGVTPIDSRFLVPYPCKRMQKDLTHFVGAEMNQWADRVSEIIERDLVERPFAASPVLASLSAAFGKKPTAVEGMPAEAICVSARLMFKSAPMRTKELLPYRESLVAYVYQVKNVVAGQYPQAKMVVMHPAHIGLKEQDLTPFALGKDYQMQVRLLSNTVWRAEKCRDDSDELDLQPYIQVQDERKFPARVR